MAAYYARRGEGKERVRAVSQVQSRGEVTFMLLCAQRRMMRRSRAFPSWNRVHID
eukprot:COSAG01_NODE_3013_length_6721_cov_2.328602_6_plen_55_part_00